MNDVLCAWQIMAMWYGQNHGDLVTYQVNFSKPHMPCWFLPESSPPSRGVGTTKESAPMSSWLLGMPWVANSKICTKGAWQPRWLGRAKIHARALGQKWATNGIRKPICSYFGHIWMILNDISNLLWPVGLIRHSLLGQFSVSPTASGRPVQGDDPWTFPAHGLWYSPWSCLHPAVVQKPGLIISLMIGSQNSSKIPINLIIIIKQLGFRTSNIPIAVWLTLPWWHFRRRPSTSLGAGALAGSPASPMGVAMVFAS